MTGHSKIWLCNKLPEGIGYYTINSMGDIYIYTAWWFGTFGLLFHILGMSSSQLTFTPWFFRGGPVNHQPEMMNPWMEWELGTIPATVLLL